MPSPRLIHPVRWNVSSLLALLAMGAMLANARAAWADDSDWPRQFDSPSGSFVIYQPQPEDLEGDLLTGRAAFSLQKDDAAVPIFGVIWYTEEIEIDRDSSTVTPRSLDVTKVRLPRITSEEAARYEALVEAEASQWDLSGSLKALQAGLAAAEKERASVAGLDNTPPKILFEERRSILVVYDGTPLLRPIEGSTLQRVVNTPYAVVFEPRSRLYYLNGANLWYRAADPLGPWMAVARPPSKVRDAVPPDTSSSDQLEGPAPQVLTATEPTELIATEGRPRYAPLVEDELLYLANTESDVILEVGTQDLYVLISGRWFRAPSTDGPWTFVRGDQLPESFKRVPPDSPKGNILASVAGTDQAEDALADAEIPQTSAIQRGDQSFEATYDGDPQFEPIDDTDLQYAVNTDAEILLADGLYYACDQGVWYIADDPYGPWSVSDTRPLGVEEIPPSCPVYDTRYVYVYDATPEVVYVGYLPGYVGCYAYYGTVVYGTGYRYRSWRARSQYYPRRFTWGFLARYNPWLNRWSFGYSYGAGFLRVSSRWRSDTAAPAKSRTRAKWFGPGGYRRPLVAADRTLLRTRPTERVRTRVADGLPANVYNRVENVGRVDRNAIRIRTRSVARPIVRSVPTPDDVFAGKDGKVYRRDTKGRWEVRTGTAWKPTSLPTPPAPSPPQDAREPIRRPEIRKSRPDVSARRPDPAVDRPVTPRREPPVERPAPRPNRPEIQTPGDLEREYRARQRAERAEKPEAPPPTARPTPPTEEPRNRKGDEPSKEKPNQRSRDDSRRDRGR